MGVRVRVRVRLALSLSLSLSLALTQLVTAIGSALRLSDGTGCSMPAPRANNLAVLQARVRARARVGPG